MQHPIPFSSDTEFILETFSDSNKIIECLPKISRHRNTKKFLGSVYNDIEESYGSLLVQSTGMGLSGVRRGLGESDGSWRGGGGSKGGSREVLGGPWKRSFCFCC